MPIQPPIPNRQLSTKSPKIRHRQLCTSPIRTITKADRFFTFRKTSASIFVRNTHHNVVSFRNNAFMFTKVIRKPYRKFTTFLYRLICFLRVRWTAKSNYGSFIMNVGAFERTLDIAKLYEMSISIMLERNFFQHRTIKWSNFGIRKQVIRRRLFLRITMFIWILGQVKSKFSMRKIPYCVSFNPSEHKQHLFIAGMSDKKILCVRFFVNK